ncbi:DUF3489 domain-containing protein [Roseomonas sp. BN140053]|uniref:DUF3489 domain-containing protein n=1 Tax=Roseomonas sp. BN140053 TaxID=3391898 RepID=UPI0039EA1A6E
MAKQNHAATLPDFPAPPRQAIIVSLLKTGLLAQKPAPIQEDRLDPRASELGLAAAGAPTGGGQPVEAPTYAPGGLRAAAQAVLAAWDAQGRPDTLSTALERLRTSLARRSAQPAPSGQRTPRAGTKQAAVLALLRRPEGATVAQVVEATGWAPHTVRGFLAGLKRRGIPIDVVERVRQVGPGRAGAKGSYSVYRVAEAG